MSSPKEKQIAILREHGQAWKNESLIVTKKIFKGHISFDVRVWYVSSDGTLLPTKKGIYLSRTEKNSVIKALESLDKE